MTYDELINTWQGKQVTKYGGQCVGLVAEFESANGRPIVWGDAALWVNNPIMHSVYDWQPRTPDNYMPLRGDIIVWGSDLPYTNGGGHIAFFDRPIDHLTFWSFGQNSGGKSAHFQVVHWEHVAGWYRLKQQQVAPQPALYTIEPISARLVQVQPGKSKWNLAYGSFNDVAANPITTSDNDTKFTAVAVLHHRAIPQYNYYLEDANTPHGWNVLDCNDYTAPPPVIKPPEAPITAKPAEKYQLLTTVPYFADSNSAHFHKGQAKVLDAGSYFVWSRDDNVINLTDNNIKNQDKWINTDDNVAPVVVVPPLPPKITEVIQAAAQNIPEAAPQPITPPVTAVDVSWKKMTYLRPDKRPVDFIANSLQPVLIHDFVTKQALGYIRPTKGYKFVGWYQRPDGKGVIRTYYRREIDIEKDCWPTIEDVYVVEEPNQDNEFTYEQKMQGWFDINKRRIGQAVVKARKLIDGIVERQK